MQHRISRKKYNIFALDIESHNDEESLQRKETSMWIGSFIDENSKIDDENSYFYTMDELINRLEILSAPKRNKAKTRLCNNVCIYIYNLSFEWSFLLPQLLKRGFEFKEKIEEDDEYVFNSITTKSVSSVWLVNLKFSKNSGSIIFRDLAKIYGGGLGAVAKAFNLPTQKGEIDYRKNRLHNYQVTKEEKEYCFKDTRIIIDILLQLMEDKTFWNCSSMATYSIKTMIQKGFPRSIKPYKEFRKIYPILNEKESEFMRNLVAGGLTFASDRWQFKTINNKVLHIDAHQMYPSQMYKNLFPYGEGEYFTGKPTQYFGKMNAVHILVSYTGVKLHSIIKLFGLDFMDDVELYVWDFEIATMRKCYENLEIKYIDGYSYSMRPLPWRKCFLENYTKRLEAKTNNDAFNTLRYKLLNNSSYGKLLEKPHNEVFRNTIDDDGIIDSIVEDKEKVEISAKYTYLPVGTMIPAYARCCLIETALKFNWKNVIYVDTDSIFVIYDNDAKRVWENEINNRDELGGWGIEEMIDKSQFTASKRYKTLVDGKTSIKAGGINFKEYISRKAKEKKIKEEDYQIDFDEINLVNSSWKVQRAFRCKGGTLIDFQNKEIKVVKKYIPIYNQNMLI